MSLVGSFAFAWKLQRYEIAFVAIVCLALAATAAWLTFDMRSIYAHCGTPGATAACDVVYAFQETHGSWVQTTQMAIGLMPVLVGLVLGVPIVSREIEHRTAQIAWPMSRSRVQWLAWRVVPVLVIGLLLVALPAVAADQMERAYFPRSDIGFYLYDSRGLPLVMRAAVLLLAGVALGAILGRLLPGLLLGIGVAIALTVGLATALPHWVSSAELSVPESAMSGAFPLTTDIQFRLPDGRIVDDSAAEAAFEQAAAAAGRDEPAPALLPQEVDYGVAASRVAEVLVRETAALILACLVIAGVTAAVLRRRRPGW